MPPKSDSTEDRQKDDERNGQSDENDKTRESRFPGGERWENQLPTAPSPNIETITSGVSVQNPNRQRGVLAADSLIDDILRRAAE